MHVPCRSGFSRELLAIPYRCSRLKPLLCVTSTRRLHKTDDDSYRPVYNHPMSSPAQKPRNVGFVSLGCPKALVDADWLADFDAKLAAYRAAAEGG